METDFTGKILDNHLTIDLNALGVINYYSTIPTIFNHESVVILMDHGKLIEVGLGGMINQTKGTNCIEIIIPQKIDQTDFLKFLVSEMKKGGYTLSFDPDVEMDDDEIDQYQDYLNGILPILNAFGFSLNEIKKRPAKPRHKYSVALAEIPFTIDYLGSKATVYWIKRNQFIIKKGAILVAEPPLTKAGVVGFAGKFGLRLRQEHANQIVDNILTEDVILQSVNEVGTFLYFAGTNSWLQLKSPEGKTLNELTIVE